MTKNKSSYGYLLPRIRGQTIMFGFKTTFSKVDLVRACNQFSMATDEIHKMDYFITLGLCKYCACISSQEILHKLSN